VTRDTHSENTLGLPKVFFVGSDASHTAKWRAELSCGRAWRYRLVVAMLE
jgi:hypothetical protein